MRELDLKRNGLGAEAVAAMAHVLDEGGLPRLTNLCTSLEPPMPYWRGTYVTLDRQPTEPLWPRVKLVAVPRSEGAPAPQQEGGGASESTLQLQRTCANCSAAMPNADRRCLPEGVCRVCRHRYVLPWGDLLRTVCRTRRVRLDDGEYDARCNDSEYGCQCAACSGLFDVRY